MASENHIYKLSNAGGFKTLTRYPDMLAGNTVWSPWSPAGAYDALAVYTVPSGGVSTVTFAGIPQTYKHLQIRMIARYNGTGGVQQFPMTFNNDSSAIYDDHVLRGNGSSATSGYDLSGTAIYAERLPTNSNNAGTFGANTIDILDYASTTKTKVTRTFGGYDDNGSGMIAFCSGMWNSTAAINRIDFPFAFTQNSQFALYGVK